MSWTHGAGIALAASALIMLGAASEGMAEKKDGKEVSGKELYKTSCKVCHMKDSKNGEYTPMTLIGEQWTRFFEKKYGETHKDLTFPKQEDGKEGGKLSETLTPEVLKQIQKFCEEHAADSEQPMTCG